MVGGERVCEGVSWGVGGGWEEERLKMRKRVNFDCKLQWDVV